MSLPLPSSQCKDVGTRAALVAAINGIATCLPDATEVQTLKDSIGTCTSFYTVFLTWIAVVWKAICYVFASIGTSGDTLQAEIDAIQDEVEVIQGDISDIQAQLPTPHTGTPTFTGNDAVAGTGATYSIQAGSTDTDGAVILLLGSAPAAAGGHMGDLVFGASFANVIYPTLGVSTKSPGGLIANALVSNSGPIVSIDTYVWAPSANLAQNNVVKIFYHIGYTS